MRPYYIDQRPLRWCAGEDGIHRDAILRVLQAVQTLETHEPPRDTAEAPSAELLALQNRLDLLIGMVSQLCASQLGSHRPPSRPFVCHSDGILWPAEDLSPGPGQLELYLHDVLPEPLRLTGSLQIPDADAEDQAGLADLCTVLRSAHPQVGRIACMNWDCDDTEVRDALTRHVFRHHRRSLARRQSTNPAPPSS